MPLTPADVHNVAFSKPPIGKRGYNEDEVDQFLDFVEAEEILLTSLDEDGYASAGVLSDHPDYGHWKGVMDPGEFWSSVGESWVVQKT